MTDNPYEPDFNERVHQLKHKYDTFVPALRDPAPPPVAPAWLTERQPMDLVSAFTSLPGANESTSAMDRAHALRVRVMPFVGVWVLIAIIVGVVVFAVAKHAPGAALVALLVFAGLTAFSYFKLNKVDYEYSREGSERHKVDTAANLMRQNMDHEYRLREMALAAYLKNLENRP